MYFDISLYRASEKSRPDVNNQWKGGGGEDLAVCQIFIRVPHMKQSTNHHYYKNAQVIKKETEERRDRVHEAAECAEK